MHSDKSVVLCVDDFGISPSVSRSICTLAERKRISATSVMVVYEDWNKYCRQLLGHKTDIDIGLHFVLTQACPILPSESVPSLIGKDGKFFGMSDFMKRAYLGRIKGSEVFSELLAQYNRFVESFGVEPDFLDGHHNVHQCPIVGEEVIRFVKKKDLQNKIYIRNTAHQLSSTLRGSNFLKTLFISFPGLLFKRKLGSNGLLTNKSFGGVYNLKKPAGFEKLIREFFISAARENGIIMVHPGTVDSTLMNRDTFCEGREIEEEVLLRDSYRTFLEESKISLSKFKY